MQLIADILEAAMLELADKSVIDFYPDDNEPETFEAECEIDASGSVITVEMCGWYVFLHQVNKHLEAYYAMSTTFVTCSACGNKHPINEQPCEVCEWVEWKKTRTTCETCGMYYDIRETHAHPYSQKGN